MDTAARMGGDEFVILLEDLSKNHGEAIEHVRKISEKIRAAIDKPFTINDYEHNSSPSIGVCFFLGGQVTENEVLSNADKAMYQAKNAGRNRVVIFEDTA